MQHHYEVAPEPTYFTKGRTRTPPLYVVREAGTAFPLEVALCWRRETAGQIAALLNEQGDLPARLRRLLRDFGHTRHAPALGDLIARIEHEEAGR